MANEEEERLERKKRIFKNILDDAASIGAGALTYAHGHKLQSAAQQYTGDKFLQHLRNNRGDKAEYNKIIKSLGGMADSRATNKIDPIASGLGSTGDVLAFKGVKNKDGGKKNIYISRPKDIGPMNDSLGMGFMAEGDAPKYLNAKAKRQHEQGMSGLAGENLKTTKGRKHIVLHVPTGKDSAGKVIGHNNPSILLHELGHAAGSGRTDTVKHKIINANKDLAIKMQNYQQHSFKSPIGTIETRRGVQAFAPTVAGAFAKRRSGESEQDYLARRRKYERVGSALSTLPEVPLLAEEARASINAIRLAKKIGVKPGYGTLGRAYATYLAGGLTVPAAKFLADEAVYQTRKRALDARGEKNS